MAGSSSSAQAVMLAIGIALFAVIVASAHAVGRQLATRAWISPRDEIIFKFSENVTIGEEVVVLPAFGQGKMAVTDDFLRFKTLIDKGAFVDGKKTGLQLQLKQ